MFEDLEIDLTDEDIDHDLHLDILNADLSTYPIDEDS